MACWRGSARCVCSERVIQRCDSSTERASRSRVTLSGGSSSSGMMMSAPSDFCASTADSGVSLRTEPSRYERKRTPRSLIESSVPALRPRAAARRLSSGASSSVSLPSEKTWKPPESVISGGPSGRPMKRCSPPAASTTSTPGCTMRWYVLQNCSCTPQEAAWAFVMPLSAAFVPTGTKHGVSMTPCGVWMRPTRAREPGLRDSCRTSKRKPGGAVSSAAEASGKAKAVILRSRDSVLSSHFASSRRYQPEAVRRHVRSAPT
mmetsp:Transcript_33861/g.112959  ORF Transcript_33861/g.112959 Transcript_33861/m.112959 type:complete len:262 (+) Transcript_33861:585-1370(+)